MTCFLSRLVAILILSGCTRLWAQDFLVVDQSLQPGALLSLRGQNTTQYWRRGMTTDRLVPKICSFAQLSDGSIAFCSGLDRSIMLLRNTGESELHHSGYLARQVRADSNGDLYWSGLETPQNNNPLPDGFIYRRRASSGQVETLLTFSQELVGKDWWGAFDVRDGNVYVATLRAPASIYRLENSIPVHLATVNCGISSMRVESDMSVLISDGEGRIFRVPLQSAQNLELIVQREFLISDFLPIRN